ncbi:hypothetical protein [Candidatus Planktophila dulcis]|uniref:hypothetical protein n=1 Tax=Candidatus Planktophila dulcis TaxID=1884914 RepID=UPI003BEECDA3
MLNANSMKSKNWLLANYSRLNIQRSRLVAERIAMTPPDWELQISKRIGAGEPILFGRLGGLEAECLGIYMNLQRKNQNPIRFAQSSVLRSRRQHQLCTNAGVFPINRETFSYFASEYLEALEHLNIFSVWAKPSAWVESNYVQETKTLFVTGDASYPWPESRDGVSKHGWGMALDNKRVLVVSPFIDSFEQQSSKLHKIFQGIDYPTMNLQFLRAPLTQGGLDDGSTYESHLLELKNRMSEKRFDVALVSAGAYSLPLAYHAKKLGSIGIHAGGALQLFFGVTGQRYDGYNQVKRFFNADWKRPFEHERPNNWRDIEQGCYW